MTRENKQEIKMECKHCHGPMMAETVIQLRRGLFGFRETRAAGAYCASCQVGVLVAGEPAPPRPARLRRTAAWRWPASGRRSRYPTLHAKPMGA